MQIAHWLLLNENQMEFRIYITIVPTYNSSIRIYIVCVCVFVISRSNARLIGSPISWRRQGQNEMKKKTTECSLLYKQKCVLQVANEMWNSHLRVSAFGSLNHGGYFKYRNWMKGKINRILWTWSSIENENKYDEKKRRKKR